MIIIFLGPPGSGKGTYSTRVAELMDLPHISTGDIFREAIINGTNLGKQVNEYLKKGELVPDNVTIHVLKERIEKPDCLNGFILDGFPRTLQQAQALDALVQVDVVINLKIHEKVLIEKLSARRICINCGEIYNIVNVYEIIEGILYDMPPMLPKTPGICDTCGEKIIQRKDDQPEVIKARLQMYPKQFEPLISYYRDQGLVLDVNVHSGYVKTVPRVMAKLKEFIKNT